MFSKYLVPSNPAYYESNPSYYEFSEQQLAHINPNNYLGLLDSTVYESNEFRIYGFKIKKCPRTRSHDWTQCPFAHRGEKAKRRDPRRYNYAAVPCPDFQDGDCIRGETCQYAHGVFEYWLHPDKYRTRLCSAGGSCYRRVCFFAHSSSELRPDPNAKCHAVCQAQPERENSVGNGYIAYKTQQESEHIEGSRYFNIGASSSWSKPPQPVMSPKPPVVTTDFLTSLSGLQITTNDETSKESRFLRWFSEN